VINPETGRKIMFSNKGFRLAGGLVIVCALLLAGTALGTRWMTSSPSFAM
jgi:hypothetical protein